MVFYEVFIIFYFLNWFYNKVTIAFTTLGYVIIIVINPQRAKLAGGYTKSLHGSLQVDMNAKGVTWVCRFETNITANKLNLYMVVYR